MADNSGAWKVIYSVRLSASNHHGYDPTEYHHHHRHASLAAAPALDAVSRSRLRRWRINVELHLQARRVPSLLAWFELAYFFCPRGMVTTISLDSFIDVLPALWIAAATRRPLYIHSFSSLSSSLLFISPFLLLLFKWKTFSMSTEKVYERWETE